MHVLLQIRLLTYFIINLVVSVFVYMPAGDYLAFIVKQLDRQYKWRTVSSTGQMLYCLNHVKTNDRREDVMKRN